MNETIIYNVWHENPYGYLVLVYFFLAGTSGGSLLVSAFSKIYGKERYRAVSDVGAVAALVLIAVGGICLWLDLGRIERVYLLFLRFHVTSPVSWGAPIINLFAICTVVYIYYSLFAKDDRKARLLAKIGIVLAVALTTYTGFLLSMAKARPLWHSAIMAPLFLVSSGIAGLALILLLVNLLNKYAPEDEVVKTLGRTLIILIVIDIFFLSDMYVLYVGLSEAQEVALLLLVGKFAFLFWGVELVLGSVLPIVILSTKNLATTKQWQIVASALALVGVFTMRYIIVIIGQYLPLS